MKRKVNVDVGGLRLSEARGERGRVYVKLKLRYVQEYIKEELVAG